MNYFSCTHIEKRAIGKLTPHISSARETVEGSEPRKRFHGWVYGGTGGVSLGKRINAAKGHKA